MSEPSGITRALQKLRDITAGIRAVFCVDRGGLPIEDIGLVATLGRDSANMLTYLAAGILSSMLKIQNELGSEAWDSFSSESQSHQFLLYNVDNIAIVGIIADAVTNMGLLRLQAADSIDQIRNELRLILSNTRTR
ncbi:MAG: roadblock/LC7 domain-containing protein [Candidatus Hermodarchaeota archaeon]